MWRVLIRLTATVRIRTRGDRATIGRVGRVAGVVALVVAAAWLVPASAGAGSSCPLPEFGPGQDYHPHIEPANFSPNVTNKLFPLTPGKTLIYTGTKDGKKALNLVATTSRTKVIDRVRSRVVEDRLYLNNVLEERTSDYYAPGPLRQRLVLRRGHRHTGQPRQRRRHRGVLPRRRRRRPTRSVHAGAPAGRPQVPPGVVPGPRRGRVQGDQPLRAGHRTLRLVPPRLANRGDHRPGTGRGLLRCADSRRAEAPAHLQIRLRPRVRRRRTPLAGSLAPRRPTRSVLAGGSGQRHAQR